MGSARLAGAFVSESVTAIETREFMGARVEAATMQQVLDRCEKAVESRERLILGVVNAAKLVKMDQDEALRDAVLGADMVLADGMAVVWASRILGKPLPERVSGIDLFEKLLEVADRRGFSAYFLGASEEVLASVLEIVRRRHPGARIAGSRNGYFSDEETESVAAEINAARPDLLFVGISTPKKERFIADWGPKLDVAVCHGVGGAFDVLGGKVPRAPAWMQALGLEWLYRVIQEPRRMWKRYLVTNTLFILGLMKEWFRR
jgi:N-acetylglucosaminyldiphosphoundecaprenol N-acetyl-beta-D-mannosaminyltransferase